MDAILASVAVLFVVGGLPAKGNEPENSTTSRSKIPEGFYLSASDIHAKHITILEMKNVSFTGRELDAFEISHLSVDEKCSRGLPLSAAWQYYGPYVRPGMRDGKVAVEGIFPHIINKMLYVCCNSSTTVKYGKIFDSIRGLEGQLNQPETAYDFSFPVTGKSLGDESFKDLPYIPIVQAPRVALLVRDKTENTKTAQLMNTVFKAWPILIFILVAATLSGIIIWLLVSVKLYLKALLLFALECIFTCTSLWKILS